MNSDPDWPGSHHVNSVVSSTSIIIFSLVMGMFVDALWLMFWWKKRKKF